MSTSPKMCCGAPPVISTEAQEGGRQVHTIKCASCGRSETSGNKEYSVHKFNQAVTGGKSKSSGTEEIGEKIRRELRELSARSLHADAEQAWMYDRSAV